MPWIYVLLAGIVEVFWVLGLRYSETLWEWLGTAVLIIASFYLIIKACEQLPSGTVYAVFTGMGASAIVVIDFVFGDGVFSWVKIIFIAMILCGVIGIKLTTDEKQPESNEQATQTGT